MRVDAARDPAREISAGPDETVPGNADRRGVNEAVARRGRAAVGRIVNRRARRGRGDGEREGRVVETAIHAELRVGDHAEKTRIIQRAGRGHGEITAGRDAHKSGHELRFEEEVVVAGTAVQRLHGEHIRPGHEQRGRAGQKHVFGDGCGIGGGGRRIPSRAGWCMATCDLRSVEVGNEAVVITNVERELVERARIGHDERLARVKSGVLSRERGHVAVRGGDGDRGNQLKRVDENRCIIYGRTGVAPSGDQNLPARIYGR